MAHGKHRRATPRKLTTSIKSLIDEASVRPQLTEQEHTLHDGDDIELVFNLMACIHPAQCTCETDYPNWKPGMR